MINSDLIDQLSNSDDNPLSVHNWHAQNTFDEFLAAFHHVFLQPCGDITDVKNLSCRGNVPRDLSQRTGQVGVTRSVDTRLLRFVIHFEDHGELIALNRCLKKMKNLIIRVVYIRELVSFRQIVCLTKRLIFLHV